MSGRQTGFGSDSGLETETVTESETRTWTLTEFDKMFDFV